MEEMRRQFESWRQSDNPFAPLSRDESGEYVDMFTWLAWKSWLASRAALVVELPEPFKLAKASSGLTYYYEDEVDKALRAAGITAKGEGDGGKS